jgi:hypothetical protein
VDGDGGYGTRGQVAEQRAEAVDLGDQELLAVLGGAERYREVFIS